MTEVPVEVTRVRKSWLLEWVSFLIGEVGWHAACGVSWYIFCPSELERERCHLGPSSAISGNARRMRCGPRESERERERGRERER